MNLLERFTAAFAVLTGKAELAAQDGKPELSEDNVAAFEAAADEVKNLRAANEQLKDAAQEHAQAVSDLETKVSDAEEKVTVAEEKLNPIEAALKDNNIDVAEDSDAVATAVDTINKWGNEGGKPSGTGVTGADELGEEKVNDYHTSIDDEVAQAREELGFDKK
ncbi:MAG: hypothetical protein ACPGD8_05130 [Flavobacteriales bacterium]